MKEREERERNKLERESFSEEIKRLIVSSLFQKN